MRRRPVEELRRLGRAPLAAAQLGESHERVFVAARPQPAELACAGDELELRLRPVAMPEQNVRVVGPADRKHLPVAEAGRDFSHPQAPLARPLEIADSFARVDHEAADRLDRVRIGHLAADGRCGGGIELAHPLVDPPDADEREPFERESEHLQVDRTDQAGELTRLGGACPRCFGVVTSEEGEVRADERHERGGRRGRAAVDQHRRSLCPAHSFGGAVKRVGVVGELHGDQCCCVVVAEGTCEAERSLVRVEGRDRIELVASGDAEAHERVDRLLRCRCPREGRAGLLPGAARERGLSGLDQRDGCRGLRA